MSRGVKILLGTLAAIFALGILAAGALVASLPKLGNAFVSSVTDSANTRRIGAQIADYRLPPGYRELMALDLLGNRFLTIGPAQKHGTIIMLFQTNEAKLDPKDVEGRFTAQFNDRASSSCKEFHAIGKETLPIAGNATAFSIAECERDGVRRRQEAGIFELRGHPTMLMASGQADQWNAQAIHAFAASLR